MITKIEFSIYTENVTSYYEGDYVKIQIGEEEIKTQFSPDFQPDGFFTMVAKPTLYTFDGHTYLPLTNCSCGSFECGGQVTELIETENTYLFKNLYGAHKLSCNLLEEYGLTMEHELEYACEYEILKEAWDTALADFVKEFEHMRTFGNYIEW